MWVFKKIKYVNCKNIIVHENVKTICEKTHILFLHDLMSIAPALLSVKLY